jgi:hypothetical protein
VCAIRARSAEEDLAEGGARSRVGLGHGPGVHGERRLGVGVTELGLGGLDVDALGDEGRGVGPAQVVEGRARDASLRDRGQPDPFPPVGVVERGTLAGGEEQPVGFGCGEVVAGQVGGQGG